VWPRAELVSVRGVMSRYQQSIRFGCWSTSGKWNFNGFLRAESINCRTSSSPVQRSWGVFALRVVLIITLAVTIFVRYSDCLARFRLLWETNVLQILNFLDLQCDFLSFESPFINKLCAWRHNMPPPLQVLP